MNIKEKDKLTILIFILVLGFYLISTASSIGKPLAADEWMNYSIAESLATSGKLQSFGMVSDRWLDHPPLFHYLIALSFRIFGFGYIQARLVGVVFYILTLILIYFLTRYLYPKNIFSSLMAVVFFGLSPLAIKGSLMIEIDEAMLSFMSILFLYCFLRLEKWNTQKRILVLSLVYFLAICSKFSLPPILFISMALYWAFNKEFIKGMAETLEIAFIGTGLFLIIWLVFCCNLNIMNYCLTPFICAYKSFVNHQVKGTSLGIIFFRLSLWVSPFFLFLGFYIMGKQFKLGLKYKTVPRDFIFCSFIIIMLIGYLFIGGLSFGFPKTHLPIMPVLAVLIAGNFSWSIFDKRDLAKLLIILVIALFLFLTCVGDIVYLVNYALKEALIFNFRIGFMRFALPLFLYFASPFLLLGILHLFFFQWRLINKILTALIITTLAANLSLDILQLKVDYLTGAEYGARGKAQLINLLKGVLTPDDTILSTEELKYDLRLAKSPTVSMVTWNNLEEFLRFLKEKEPRAVIYGVPLNTIKQFKKILFNPSVLEFLQKHYKRQDVGSYLVWLKQ